MNIERIQHILNFLMIISFLIFLGLSGFILLSDTDLAPQVVSLPFAFLFVSATTLIITGEIQEQPTLVRKHLHTWLAICIFGVTLAALAFTFA